MFFLSSISGFLPYILAFSITLIWGGHAGLPYFKAGSPAESKNEISKEEDISADHLGSYSYKKQIINEKNDNDPVIGCHETKVLNFFLCHLPDFAGIGISSLRAPPIYLF